MNGVRGLVIGIDVGTTSSKAIAIDVTTGNAVATAKAPTRWDIGAFGEVQTDIDRFADDAIAVMARAAEQVPNAPVVGIGITGLAETGAVIDHRGRAITPAMAWYDQRGKDELAALPEVFHSEFSAVTGLAYKSECSLAKLLWLRGQGVTIEHGDTWANALEYIAFRLTGVRATEPSLASRTGLLDQDAVAPWAEALDLVGVDATFIPQVVHAGTGIGHVTETAPQRLRGAAVTVAGHDHLVGAVGAGASGVDDLYNSCGTADVIIRTVSRTLTNDERSSLVGRGLSAGRHVLPGATAILGATRSGLVLGRILAMLGASDLASRRALADAWMATSDHGSVVSVEEPPSWTNEVTVRLRDNALPADVWAASMDYVLGQTQGLLRSIEETAGTYENAIAAGGWSRLDGVFRGKAGLMPGLHCSPVHEPGARGAALFAAAAAGQNASGWSPEAFAQHTTDEESF